MSQGASGRPSPENRYGPPADDALVARLFPPLPGRVEWGLERTRRILAAVGDPHRAAPVLHVGGTNGKGSVARVLAEVLEAAGYRVGLATSPHLVSFRERILVDGQPLADRLLEGCADDLRPLFLAESPSFFEAVTCLSFLAMARSKVDFMVVEVGLGGRLDATNVVDPTVSIVTNVGFDHTEYLGDTRQAIAREKAGIFRSGIPAFSGEGHPEAREALVREASRVGTPLIFVDPPEGDFSAAGLRLHLKSSRWGELELLSPLLGAHQLHNVALAVRALEAFPQKLPAEAVCAGVTAARIPGRMQRMQDEGRSWLLDVAHNLEGVRTLVESVRALNLPKPLVGVVGILGDKPWLPMLEELASVLDPVILTVPPSAPSDRVWNLDEAAQSLAPGRGRGEPGFRRALERAQKGAGAGGSILVTGSVHTVGDALRSMGWIPSEALPLPDESG